LFGLCRAQQNSGKLSFGSFGGRGFVLAGGLFRFVVVFVLQMAVALPGARRKRLPWCGYIHARALEHEHGRFAVAAPFVVERSDVVVVAGLVKQLMGCTRPAPGGSR
jgi:hypothetical protein